MKRYWCFAQMLLKELGADISRLSSGWPTYPQPPVWGSGSWLGDLIHFGSDYRYPYEKKPEIPEDLFLEIIRVVPLKELETPEQDWGRERRSAFVWRNKRWPLFTAIENKWDEGAKALIERGVRLSAPKGWTGSPSVLSLACQLDLHQTVEALLERGAAVGGESLTGLNKGKPSIIPRCARSLVVSSKVSGEGWEHVSDPFGKRGPPDVIDTNQKGPSSVAIVVTFVGGRNASGLPSHYTDLEILFGDEPYRLFNVDEYGKKENPHTCTYGKEKRGHTAGGLLSPVLWICELFSVDLSLSRHATPWDDGILSKDVRDWTDGFDSLGIPVDTVWMDIGHTDGKRYWTWDPYRFPDPEGMMKKLDDMERRGVILHDPHLKKDDSHFVYKDLLDARGLDSTSVGQRVSEMTALCSQDRAGLESLHGRAPLCNECKDGWYLLRNGSEVRCRECADRKGTLGWAVALFLMIAVLLCGYSAFVAKDTPRFDAVKIMTVFATGSGLLDDVGRPALWPRSICP
uniref:Glycoside hydrolase family 31 TIM barrel domain-containing protein n=1 Tax=Chromera velia CCMP2878 TaxID=1169474 RepID=A0A0G4FFD0_9ALVE|eukprot:Cvel_16690.t1-p1 / transcript=Cvel_16690.t1 / gene=Cvel_16690 / organism=Chromera_velia_CCMP2878 / gene_product=Glucosidase 2 subunit alpha, putative / transcript_product=Glucosidase 2 subunit alpha, putative / location=Cvel_scaffold1296:14308-20155(-) / protein_length=514 / sequence_SO=supercontig / SO=protein_coding / is_pseudo=false